MDENIVNRKLIESSLLEAYRYEYEDIIKRWHNIESKAQGTVAMSGIFLAGFLAFVQQLSKDAGLLEKSVLSLAILLLASALISCVLVLKSRERPPVLRGDIFEELVNDLIANPSSDEITKRYYLFIRDQSKIWNEINKDIEKINKDKAKHLWNAHRLIIASLVVFIIITIHIIYLS